MILVHVDEGEEARLTPGGPAAAVIESRGPLPFRVRLAAGGLHHRPAFPGSPVVVGDRCFEVVAERVEADRVLYDLDPWAEPHVLRAPVSYGEDLVRAVQAERRRGAERRRSSRWSWAAAPLLGALPEQWQVRACDRSGLDPATATLASGLAEAMLAVGLLQPLPLGTRLALTPLATLVVASAAFRALLAVVFREVAGSAVVALSFEAARVVKGTLPVPSRGFVPLTREQFWARLGQPDEQTQEPDGAILVRGQLPHLTWTPSHRLQAGSDYWTIESLVPGYAGGRLLYAYRLRPVSPTAASAPGPQAYQQELRERIDREWTDLLRSGLEPLVSLLPASVQRRALGRRGGSGRVRIAALVTSLAQLPAAVWFFTGSGPLNALTGLFLAADGVQRLWRVAQDDYAPSLAGGLISDLLRPERAAYHEHRDAERGVLSALRPT